MSNSVLDIFRQAREKSDRTFLDPDELELFRMPVRQKPEDLVKDIRLPGKSNVLDRIDLSLTPYSILPIQCIGKEGVDWIMTIAPTQSGKTVQLQTFVAESIMQSPGPMMYILPDEKSGKRALEEKIIDMIKETPALRRHTMKPWRTSLSTVGINLDNMSIFPAWSGSPASMNSLPCQRVALDEVRLMKLFVGKETNAIKYANDRLTTYRSYGMSQGMLVSTPSIVGDLLHQQLDVPGTTVLWWYVKCKECGKYQVLNFFTHMRYDDYLKRPVVTCTFCHHEFSDSCQKRELNKDGGYAPFGHDGVSELPPIQYSSRMVFRFCSMVSPFRTFAMISNEYWETKDKPHDYRNFVQCWLAQFYEDRESTIDIEDLRKRQGDYTRGVVPDDCLVITAGLDTQDDGWYVVVRAWGKQHRTYLIDNYKLVCHMTASADYMAELLIENLENRVYESLSGQKWMIALYAIDIGGHRSNQLTLAGHHLSRHIFVFGRNSQQRETLKVSNSKACTFYVRTWDYAEETEVACTKDYWYLYAGVDKDYLYQYLKYVKVSDYNARTGDRQIRWKKDGQNDYRMADIHSWIAIDIGLGSESRTIRNNLHVDGWSLNPYINKALLSRNLPYQGGPSETEEANIAQADYREAVGFIGENPYHQSYTTSSQSVGGSW